MRKKPRRKIGIKNGKGWKFENKIRKKSRLVEYIPRK